MLNPPMSNYENLLIENPYLQKSYDELLYLLTSESDECPSSNRWSKYIVALLNNCDMKFIEDCEVYNEAKNEQSA